MPATWPMNRLVSLVSACEEKSDHSEISSPVQCRTLSHHLQARQSSQLPTHQYTIHRISPPMSRCTTRQKDAGAEPWMTTMNLIAQQPRTLSLTLTANKCRLFAPV